MGQSQSTDYPELYEFPPPVQTRGITTPMFSLRHMTWTNCFVEELTQRHADRVASYLGEDRRCWFEEVFNVFCDDTSESTKC